MNSPSGQVLTWHEDCLQCCKCQAALNTENVVFNEKLFCKSCYVDTMLNKCDACVKVMINLKVKNFLYKFFLCFSQLQALASHSEEGFGTILALPVIFAKLFLMKENLGI